MTCTDDPLVRLVGKASASRAEDLGFNFGFLSWELFRVESYQWLKNCDSSGYPAMRLGQRWNWLARCQYVVIGCDRKFDLQALSPCDRTCACQIRPWDALPCSWDVKQPTNKTNKLCTVLAARLVSRETTQIWSRSGWVSEWVCVRDGGREGERREGGSG